MSTCEAMWAASGISVYFTRYSRYSSIFPRISEEKLFQITEDTQKDGNHIVAKSVESLLVLAISKANDDEELFESIWKVLSQSSE